MSQTEAPSQELAPITFSGARLPLTVEARKQFSQDTIDLLAARVDGGVPVPLLYSYVELAARYDLDPFANEIWLANMGGANGGSGKIAILVGRDGFLKIAKRDRAFVGCFGQPVYENDELDVSFDEELSASVKFKPAHPKGRGKPLGAWAVLKRKGLPTLYFFAPLEQFKKGGGAWKYEDPMIVKCAQSYLLRTTYGISGVVPWDEVSVGFQPVDAEASAVEDAPPPLPPAIARLFEHAAALDPRSWRRNEVEARIYSAEGEVLEPEIRRVERDLREWLEAEGVDLEQFDEDVTDAVVVDEALSGDLPADPGEAPNPTPEAQSAREAPGAAGEPRGFAEHLTALVDRWENDPEWAEPVAVLIRRRNDLDASLADVPDAQRQDVVDELAKVEAELDEAGVPRGWDPPIAGQAGLDITF